MIPAPIRMDRGLFLRPSRLIAACLLPTVLLLAGLLPSPPAAWADDPAVTEAEVRRFVRDWPALARLRISNKAAPHGAEDNATKNDGPEHGATDEDAWLAQRGWTATRISEAARRISAAVMELEAGELARELAGQRPPDANRESGGEANASRNAALLDTVTQSPDLTEEQRAMILRMAGQPTRRVAPPANCSVDVTKGELRLARRYRGALWEALEDAADRGLTP